MSKEIRFTRTSLILYGLGIVIVAFLGVVMGNWFIGSRQSGAYDYQMGLRPNSTALLKKGDRFPSIDLVDLDGRAVNTVSVTAGYKTVIITLSPACEPCALAVGEWSHYVDDIPPDMRILGITDTDPLQAVSYREKTAFPFPIYCDTAHVLPVVYGLNSYPTRIGINEAGRVSFVGEGWSDGFTPLDAYELITSME
jgi:hypothetical protein